MTLGSILRHSVVIVAVSAVALFRALPHINNNIWLQVIVRTTSTGVIYAVGM